MRELHDLHWRDPSQEPRLPNEEFFVSRLGPRAGPAPRTGRQLREREAEQLRGRVSGPGPGSYLDIHDYKALCQGGTVPGVEGERGRGCRLSTNGDPYFILGNQWIEECCNETCMDIGYLLRTFQDLFTRRCSRSLHLSSCSTTSSQVKKSSS